LAFAHDVANRRRLGDAERVFVATAAAAIGSAIDRLVRGGAAACAQATALVTTATAICASTATAVTRSFARGSATTTTTTTTTTTPAGTIVARSTTATFTRRGCGGFTRCIVANRRRRRCSRCDHGPDDVGRAATTAAPTAASACAFRAVAELVDGLTLSAGCSGLEIVDSTDRVDVTDWNVGPNVAGLFAVALLPLEVGFGLPFDAREVELVGFGFASFVPSGVDVLFFGLVAGGLFRLGGVGVNDLFRIGDFLRVVFVFFVLGGVVGFGVVASGFCFAVCFVAVCFVAVCFVVVGRLGSLGGVCLGLRVFCGLCLVDFCGLFATRLGAGFRVLRDCVLGRGLVGVGSVALLDCVFGAGVVGAIFSAGRVAVACEVGLEVVGADQVFDVKEGGSLFTDVDEGRLHAGEHPAHFAEDDVAERAAVAVALDVKLGDDAVFDQRDSCLADVDVDNKGIFGHFEGPAKKSRAGLLRLGRPTDLALLVPLRLLSEEEAEARRSEIRSLGKQMNDPRAGWCDPLARRASEWVGEIDLA